MIYKLEEEQSEHFTINSNHNADAYAKFLPKVADDVDVLRIEETIATSWSGVSGCCDQETVDNNADAVFVAWVQKKLYEYRHLSYKTYGHGGGTAQCSSSRAPFPDNSRSCRGSISLDAYIEFYERK